MDNSPREPERATARIAAIALAVVALVAVLVGVTTAAAQDSEPLVVEAAQADDDAVDTDTDDVDKDHPEIEAAFEAFDACLIEQGLDLEALDDDKGAIELNADDEAAIDAAFDACDPILEKVEGIFFEGEISFEGEIFIDGGFEGCDLDLDELEDHDNADADGVEELEEAPPGS